MSSQLKYKKTPMGKIAISGINLFFFKKKKMVEELWENDTKIIQNKNN